MDEIDTTLPTNQLAPEHVCVDDIGTQLINIESVQQTIREQVSKLNNSGVHTSVLELKSLLPKLDTLQTSLRKTFDAHARPLIRDIHILQLPSELLRKVFQHVAPVSMTKRRYGTVVKYDFESIKSCRLVCHRFCDTSSHLLLYELDVSMTHASLARVDEVSRHPTISRGVKSLRIGVGHYDPVAASSFRNFADYAAETLRASLNLWEAMLEMTHLPRYEYFRENPLLDGVSRLAEVTGGLAVLEINLPEKIERCSRVLHSWTKYIRAEISDYDEDESMVALRCAYIRYNQLLTDQQVLLQENNFFRSIATAVARMPTIASLSISDTRLEDRSLWPREVDTTDESVQSAVLKPSYWYPPSFHQFDQPPVDFLYQLPLTIGRAGSSLTMLHITFTPEVDVKLSLSEEEVRDVVRASQNLRVLSITCNPFVITSRADHTSEKWSHPSKLMSLFLEAPNIHDVSLYFSGLRIPQWGKLWYNASLGPLISLLPWTKLRKVTLDGAPIDFNELAACLKQIEPEAFINLDRISLRTGTWADLLDLLRTKASCGSSVRHPRGGEDKESNPEWHKNFSSVDGQESLAVQYIRRLLLRNPLRPDNDDSDTDEAKEVQL